MDARKILHDIVDHLPEGDLVTAVRVLKGLELVSTPVEVALASAPLDDEPDDDDFDGGLTEARSEKSVSHEEMLRRLRQ